MYKLRKIAVWFSQNYRPDARALSLMRIGVALTVLADLIIRLNDLKAHYTNQGIWPSYLIDTFSGKPGSWNVHSMFDSPVWTTALFTLHFIAAVFLLAGYKTRIANLAVWLLTISLHNRNLYILQAGDDLLRLLLFWGLFLPWHTHYSLDSTKRKFREKNFFGSIGYLFLITSVYFFTISLKTSSEWHSEGSAIYYALSLEQLRLPLFGDLLYTMPGLMKLLTWLVYYTELAIPVLILWPSKKGGPRFIAFLLIILLHAGIGLCLYVGLFFVINMVSAIGLLPSAILNKLEKRLKITQRREQPKISPRPLSKIMTSLFCIVVIVISALVNLGQIKWFAYELKPQFSYPVHFFRFDQYWGMFSPTVMKKDGWYVYYGIDSLGRQWDLRLNQDYVDFTKPGHIVKMYRTDRWRKLAENMQQDGYTFLRPLYCKYFLRRWNQEHPEKKIVTLNLYFMEKETLPGYKTTPVNKKLFCICNDL